MTNFPPTHADRRIAGGKGNWELSRKEKKPTHLGDISKEDYVPSCDDGLLVEYIELLGDGRREQAASENGRASLGDQARMRRKFLDNLSRAFFGRGWI